MSAITHAILYTLLISTSIMSTVSNIVFNYVQTSSFFEPLENFCEVPESSPVEYVESEYCIADDTVCVYDVERKENMYLSLEEYVRGVMLWISIQ